MKLIVEKIIQITEHEVIDISDEYVRRQKEIDELKQSNDDEDVYKLIDLQMLNYQEIDSKIRLKPEQYRGNSYYEKGSNHAEPERTAQDSEFVWQPSR